MANVTSNDSRRRIPAAVVLNIFCTNAQASQGIQRPYIHIDIWPLRVWLAGTPVQSAQPFGNVATIHTTEIDFRATHPQSREPFFSAHQPS